MEKIFFVSLTANGHDIKVIRLGSYIKASYSSDPDRDLDNALESGGWKVKSVTQSTMDNATFCIVIHK